MTGITAIGPRSTITRGGPVAYDYESGFLYLVLCGVVATGTAFWFSRQVTSGRIKKLGVIEAEPADQPG